MKNVLFQTDEGLYDAFSILLRLEHKGIGETITGLIKDYVDQNESKLTSLPTITKSIPRQPSLFGKANDWQRFLVSIDSETFKKYDTRFWLLHDIAKLRAAFSQPLIKDTPSYNPELFYTRTNRDFMDIRLLYRGHVFPEEFKHKGNIERYTRSDRPIPD